MRAEEPDFSALAYLVASHRAGRRCGRAGTPAHLRKRLRKMRKWVLVVSIGRGRESAPYHPWQAPLRSRRFAPSRIAPGDFVERGLALASEVVGAAGLEPATLCSQSSQDAFTDEIPWKEIML